MAGIQILVVEDDPMQSKLVSLLLEEAGHTIEVAASAERALEVLQSFRPDLILMDVQLPGADGLELTRALRLHPIHGKTPIVAVTGYTDPSSVTKAREAGCNSIIWKPIDTASFAFLVRKCIGNAGGAAVDVPSDSDDLLAQMRNTFVTEGLEDCATLLTELRSNPTHAIAQIHRVVHRWAGMGARLGFPEILHQARRVEALGTAANAEYAEVVGAIETARRRFCAATRHQPDLPLALIAGLRDLRIGLANFSIEEANRIQNGAARAHIRLFMEKVDGEALDNQTGYSAVIVNECGVTAEVGVRRQQWTVPAIFIGSRSSLESLSQLPREQDFLIAPWDAEEILLRVFRLVRKTVPSHPKVAPALHMPRRRSRVLIADDDPDLVAFVSNTLERTGMECEAAASGQQALDTVTRHPPDAIILDVNMLDLDGFEVLKKLRHNLSTKTIPVLLLTARGQGSDIARGIGSGANDYVVKPFDPSDLSARVEKMITASRKQGDYVGRR